MSQALKAGTPVNVDITSAISTLGVPVIDGLMLEHAQRYIEKVITVSDSDAIQGMLSFGEQAKQWVETGRRHTYSSSALSYTRYA